MSRLFWILIPVWAALSSGCSAVMAVSGTHLHEMKTREAVHARFGEPVATGFSMTGGEYEEYRSRQKIAEPIKIPVYGLAGILTLGISEVVFVPWELTLLSWRTAWGQDVRFYYDSQGMVKSYTVNGQLGPWIPPAGTTGDVEVKLHLPGTAETESPENAPPQDAGLVREEFSQP